MNCFARLSAQLEGVVTRRLRFRAARCSDGAFLFEASRNPFFNRHLLWSQPSDLESVLKRMDGYAIAHRRGLMSALSVVERDSDRWVALWRFVAIPGSQDGVELGLWIHGNCFRANYGLEISAAAIDAAFGLTELAFLQAACTPANRGAPAVIHRCGFRLHRRNSRRHEDGHALELIEHRLTRACWIRHSGGLKASIPRPPGRLAPASSSASAP